MKRMSFFIGCFPLFLMACSAASTPVTETFTTVPVLVTPVPELTATPTPVVLTSRVKEDLVNCRFGPGTGYVLVNEFSQGLAVRVVGRNEFSTWLYVRDPGNPGGFCWLSTSVMETQGTVDQLSVQPPPFVTVTDVSLRVEPVRILVNCDQFPQTVFFEAMITANGPTLMTWKWEASTGVSSNEGTMIFEEAGTKNINDYYQIGAPNDYWVKLHILTPNERVEQVNFPVSCTP